MSRELGGRQRLVDVTILAIGAIVFATSAISAIRRYTLGLGAPFFDWTFYAGAVDRWLAGGDIYPDQRISTLGAAPGSGYAYPPASVPLMLPFASWPLGALAWETLVVSTLLLGTFAVVRVGWPDRRLMAFGLVLGAMAFVEGIMEGVAQANVNIATAGLLGFAWAGSRAITPAIGVMTVIKVFPIALAAPRGKVVFLRSAAIAGAICLVTLPLVGLDSWADYIEGLRVSKPLCGDHFWLNLSLACTLEPYTAEFIAKWAGLILGLMFLVSALRAGPTMLGMTCATGAILAPATELHAHYWGIVFVLLVIGVATLNLRFRTRGHTSEGASETAGIPRMRAT